MVKPRGGGGVGALPIKKVIGRAAGIGAIFQLENMRLDGENEHNYMIRSIKLYDKPRHLISAVVQLLMGDLIVSINIANLLIVYLLSICLPSWRC